jgi:tetratricopeptide (TPR) repeat protein
MRRGLPLWSAIIAFQIIYGVSVFLVTRQIYQDQPTATRQELYMSQSAAQGLPHPILRGMPNENTVSLPGSERITIDDAQRLAANTVSGMDSATSVGPEELSRIADEHFREGLFQEAAVEYARVLEQASDNVDVYNNLGLTLHYIDRSREAVKVLEKGIAIDAKYQRIWLTLGFVQWGMGDVNAARPALTKAVDLDPESRVGREAKRLLDELPE